jgi:hypothetical protein
MSVLNTVMTVVVIILIIVIIRMVWKRNKVINVMSADVQQVIEVAALGNQSPTTNNCTYSIWIYVNDWSVNYGEDKVIFQRSSSPDDKPGSTNKPDLCVSLGKYESSLVVQTKILRANGLEYDMPTSSDGNYVYVCNVGKENTSDGKDANYSCIGGLEANQVPECKLKCNNNPLCVGIQTVSVPGWSQCYQVNVNEESDTPNYKLLNFATGQTGFYAQKTNTTSSYKTCIVPNIEIQKWVNITISADTNSMDIYINGKLIQSCNLEGEINVSNSTNLYISPGGNGFNGWNSRFRYLPKYINPQQAMDIYRKGHGSSNIGNLDYNVKVSLYNGSEETASINI